MNSAGRPPVLGETPGPTCPNLCHRHTCASIHTKTTEACQWATTELSRCHWHPGPPDQSPVGLSITRDYGPDTHHTGGLKELGQATQVPLDPLPLRLMDLVPTMQVAQEPGSDTLGPTRPCSQGSQTQVPPYRQAHGPRPIDQAPHWIPYPQGSNRHILHPN